LWIKWAGLVSGRGTQESYPARGWADCCACQENTLPKTRSGKIMRRVLKARAMGMPEGDLSTLEE
jgi:hypothetical protein